MSQSCSIGRKTVRVSQAYRYALLHNNTQIRLFCVSRDGLASNGRGPWHRVINAGGTISLAIAAGGARQRQLLISEGIQFTDSGRVLRGSFWEPTVAETLQFRFKS